MIPKGGIRSGDCTLKKTSGVTIEYAPGQKEPGRILLDPRLERLSQWMDTRFQIPGMEWRFGLDALLGLLPGVGDLISALIGMYIVSAAARHGVSRVTLARMGMNLGIDFVLGSVPLVGDLFDVAWKANQMNLELLRQSLSLS